MPQAKPLKTGSWIVLLFAVLALSFCATSQSVHMQADAAYVAGDYTTAIQRFEPLRSKQDKNFLLYMLDMGMTYFSAGDYYDAEKHFMSVEKSLEKQIGDLQTATQLVISDQNKVFLGDPADKVMTHIFLGLGYYIGDNFDSAEIEFKKALESDRGKEDRYEGDLSTANYFLGEIYLARQQYDKAAVAFRRTAEINPGFPYAWLGLYLTAKAERNESDIDRFWQEYGRLSGDATPREEIEKRGRLIVLNLLGWGPMKKPDAVFGAMGKVTARAYPTQSAEVTIMKGEAAVSGRDYGADDMFVQANTAGGFTADLTKKLVGAVAREAISHIPIIGSFSGLILGGNEADTRFWFTLPGRINLAVAYLEPGLYDVKVRMFDAKNVPQDHYQQNWHYIPVAKAKPTVLACRSIFDLHNQAPKTK